MEADGGEVEHECVEPSPDELSLIYNLLHFADREGERYWQRNSIFVTILSALMGLVVITAEKSGGVEIAFLGFLGALLSLSWYYVLKISKFYAERWRRDAKNYIEKREHLCGVFFTAMGKPLIDRPKGPASSKVFEVMALGSLVLSFAIMIIGAYNAWFRPSQSSVNRIDVTTVECIRVTQAVDRTCVVEVKGSVEESKLIGLLLESD